MRRKRNRIDEPMEVSMTPMIDVVFQLLIYFLVTFSTPDVLAHLDISRPAPDKSQTEERTIPKMIRISVAENGFSLNGRKVSKDELSSLLSRLASFSKTQTVLISCSGNSTHSMLVDVLDICAANELTKLSVVSTE